MSNPTPIDDAILRAYLAGRLSSEARAEVDAALAADPAMAADVALMQGIKSLGEAEPGPGDLGWARLSRAIDADEQALSGRGATPQLQAQARGPAQGWRAAALSPRFAPWQLAASVAAAIALWQAAVAPLLTPSGERSAYVPVTEAAAPHQARVTFAENATEGEMRALLVSVDAEIIAGPSALGIYTLAFADETAKQDGLEVLRTDPITETVQAE